MTVEIKIRFYKTRMGAITETCSEAIKTKSIMRSTEMKTMQLIRATTVNDKIGHTEIRKDCSVTNVEIQDRPRQEHWRDHVECNTKIVTKPHTIRPQTMKVHLRIHLKRALKEAIYVLTRLGHKSMKKKNEEIIVYQIIACLIKLKIIISKNKCNILITQTL